MSGRKRALRLLTGLGVAAVLVWTFAPLYRLFLSSLSTRVQLLTTPLRWVRLHPTLENYRVITDMGNGTGERFIYAFRNTLIIGLATTVICVVLGSLAAYAVARLKVPGKNGVVMVTLATRMLPTIALVIPFYIIEVAVLPRFTGLNLFNTKTNLIILYSSFILGLVVWIMRGYFAGIPRELEEAARIDGCSPLQAFYHVVVPLAMPGLVATALLSFLMAIDDFILALLFTRTGNAFTMPYFIYRLGGQYLHMYNEVAAAGVVASLPPVLLALFLGRKIVSGLTSGGVKG